MAKSSCEMCVVAKTAGVGNLAERLARAKRRPALQNARGVIQTKRIDEFTAGRAALRKELLEVAQRDPRFGRHVVGAEIRIGKAVPYNAADTVEQLVRMARDGRRIAWCKKCTDEIIDGQLQVGIGH